MSTFSLPPEVKRCDGVKAVSGKPAAPCVLCERRVLNKQPKMPARARRVMGLWFCEERLNAETGEVGMNSTVGMAVRS